MKIASLQKKVRMVFEITRAFKVFDIIWVMSLGGPGNSSMTLAIWSYRLGFGGGSPQLGPAAAVGNVLIVIAFIFGIFYIRAQRRALRSLRGDGIGAPPWWE